MDKHYEYKEHERTRQQTWERHKTNSHKNNAGPLYSVDTPPPTVSGKLHIGHIFSYTQTDIIARYKRMSGFSVYYPFGFDDNGLPTERFVEKKEKIQAHHVGRSEFIARCLKQTHDVELEFKELWTRMGLSVDWDYWYSTISAPVRRLSQLSFIDLYKKGYVYRHDEPALYCTTCRTSVAQAELDDLEFPSFFNDIVFQDAQGNDLIIGTTRPELLPSCVALLYHPHDPRYQHLAGTNAKVPLFDVEVPILADESVNPEKGTGLVMCCTFGDKMDIEWYKKFKLPYKQSIGLDGKWMAHTGFLAGLKAADARSAVLEKLKEEKLLIAQKPITHHVSVHERCKKEIEFVMLKQWFINIIDHKQAFLDAADTIDWYPAFMKSRYKNWVENINWNWCISRQRFFGIPFPAWHCTDCNTVILADQKDLPLDPQETPYTKPCPSCKGMNIVPDTDVMDTWNTSSITPYIVRELFNEKVDNPFDQQTIAFLPMSMRPQAHDIIRTWAFYTIVKTWMHHKTIPWKEIVISGHVLSGEHEKISKSKDNAPLDPLRLLEQYPADVLRYWTASGNLGHDVAFSENQLKIGQKLITKLWNAFRFIGEHIQTLDHAQPVETRGAINEWLLHHASETFDRYQAYFEKNEFGLALTTIEQFFWNDFCDNYLELIKNQLFNPDLYTKQEVHATRVTLYEVGLRIVQLYAPYIPHVTDTLYGLLYQKNMQTLSLHQTHFSSVQMPSTFAQSAQEIQTAIAVIGPVRKLKSERQLSLKVPLEELVINVPDNIKRLLENHIQLIMGSTHAHMVIFRHEPGATSQLTQHEDQWRGVVVIEQS